MEFATLIIDKRFDVITIIWCDFLFFKGPVKICLWNGSDRDVFIPKHTRCAQLIFERYAAPSIAVFTGKSAIERWESSLTTSSRGIKGFGSSGELKRFYSFFLCREIFLHGN